VEPASAYKKIIGGVCGNNRFHKSGDIILTLNMVKSRFSFISCTDIVQVFQSMFPDDMIAKKMALGEPLGVFGICPYLMESI
jgi:hypothetical protein